jgi:RNA polymerase-binding transcription factor DksA
MTLTAARLSTMKRKLAHHIVEHVQQKQHVPEDLRQAIFTSPSPDHLDRLMAFKTDPWFYEFRAALSRLENGSYGLCTLCNHPIPTEKLERIPTTRVCDSCVREYNLEALGL